MNTKFTCPACRTRNITLKQKYFTGLWLIITCQNCETRLTALPLLLALFSVLHVWNIAWFVMWSYYSNNFLWTLCILPVWFLIALLDLRFMPLAALRKH